MIDKDPSQTSYEQSVCNEKKNGSLPTTKPTIPARFLINLKAKAKMESPLSLFLMAIRPDGMLLRYGT